MTDDILISDNNQVRTIQFNRPEKKNALTHDMYQRVVDAMREAEEDPKIRVIVFEGTPDCFTAGNDMLDFMQTPMASFHTEGGTAPVEQFLQALATTKTPLVSVVDGIAIGVGVTMLLHCDLVYCSARSLFQTPFTALGVVPEAASSLLLPRACGHQQAAELLMLSDTINAKDALRLGFVTRVYKTTKLRKKADKKIARLAELPPSSVRMAKELMRRLPEPVEKRIEAEGKEFSARLSSAEFTEAATAFMTRRKPDFSKFE